MEIIRHMLSENITYAIGWTMLHSLWQAFVAVLVVGLLLRLRKDLPAQKRYLAAYTGMISVLLMAAGTFAWYYQPVKGSDAPAAEAVAGTTFWLEASGATDSLHLWGRFSTYFNAHLSLIVWMWIIGLAFFLIRLAAGVLYAEQLKIRGANPLRDSIQIKTRKIADQIGLKRAVRVLESALLHTPAVVGWLKPVILLPVGIVNRLSPEELEAILAHELAHILRHDYLLNLLQSFVEALFYFNPAVWQLSAMVRREREHSCDDVALRVCGNSLLYAKALVQIQEMTQPAPRMAMALRRGKGALLLRIQRILHDNHKPSSDIMEKITVTGLLLTAIFALTVRATSAAATPVKSADVAAIALDSLPPGKMRFKTDGNGERMEARIENRKLVYLSINDREIPEAELSKYESYVEQKLNEIPPPPPPPAPGNPPSPPAPLMAPAPPAPGMAPPPPPPPGMRQKTVTVEAGDDGITIIETEDGGQKNVTRTRILSPEITIIRDKDTTVVISAEGLMSIGDNKEILRELKTLMKEIEVISDEDNIEIRIDRQGREMERRAHEMERQSRGIERQAREMEWQAKEMEEQAERMKRELELKIESGAAPQWREMNPGRDFTLIGPGGRGNVQTTLENELLRDGLINDRNKYKMELSAGSLRVNGKKMPEGLARKYQKLYEERSGISLSSGGKVVVEK